MITETIGGKCPECGYNKMFMRYGSQGWFQFDACSKCGFAYGNNSERDYTKEEVWEAILNANGPTLERLGLEKSMAGLLAWTEILPRDKFAPESVFYYGKEEDYR